MPHIAIPRYEWLRDGGDADICEPPPHTQAHIEHSFILTVEGVVSLVIRKLASEVLKDASVVPRQ